MKKIVLLLFMISIASPLISLAEDSGSLALLQDESTTEKSDTTITTENDDNFLKDNFEYKKYFEKTMPTIEMSYGFANPSIHENEFVGDFAQQPIGELKIGTITKNTDVFDGAKLVDYNFTYTLFSYISNNLGSKDPDKLQSEAWRFGFGLQSGMGYNLSESSDIIFYRGDTWQWTMIQFDQDSLGSLNNTYEDAFRFGNSFEGGIKWFVAENFAIGGAYENSIIFPRHMFWYWAGSEVLYHVGDGILGAFIYSIKKSSPMAAPIVSFVLQNAYSYGFYLLRAKNMNWPINTAPPFVFEQFKFNLSLAF
jgi:hypothetical protein